MEDAQLRIRLGRAILAHRKARGLTQEQLAEAAGFSTVWVGQLERGEGLPTLDSLVRLAEALPVDASALLAAALDSDRREAVEQVVALLVALDDDAVGVVAATARALLALRRRNAPGEP